MDRLQIGIGADGTPITIRITRVHMEEDAGKSIHDRFAGAYGRRPESRRRSVGRDRERAGAASAAEADAYLRGLKQILEYVDVSDVNMEEGSLRVDANISVRLHGVTSSAPRRR